jgi:hypothetical protein
METRRDFLCGAGRLIVALPTGWMLLHTLGCSSEDECANADELKSTAAGITVTSSCNGHTHDFTITTADLTTPPATGVNGDTTAYADDGHVHTVVLTQAELAQIQSGTAVSKTCSSVLGHIHTFDFRKA